MALALVLVIASGMFVAGAGAGDASRSGSGQIYFYGNINEPISGTAVTNPLVVRPSTLLLFQDGSWVITNLRWSGWGSSVARATGVSSASNCRPSCAGGKRTTRPAQFTLSSPGRVQGHEVYRCFQLTVPSFPKANKQGCLGPQGSLTIYVSTTVHMADFLSHDRKIWCDFSNVPGARQAKCGYGPASQHSATVDPGGQVTICEAAQCLQNWDGIAPVLGVGQIDEIYGYRCTSAQQGITCTVIAGAGKGKGFLITNTSVTKVGP
jgi:hypothetical protein